MPARPLVSVTLPTRNRPAHALECVKTILANTELHELFVVDQSDGTETRDAMEALGDARLKYVGSRERGVTVSRNAGIDLASGDVVAFTDDDCRVPTHWVSKLADVFETDPDAAVVCGRVHVPEELQSQGFAESFEPRVREWKGRYPPFGSDWGITANFALRKSAVARVGKFDEMLGAGAPLRSGGEPDLIFRMLRAGLKVVNAAEVSVEHLGIRAPGEESSKLMRGYGVGTGAAFFKHVRLGDRDAMGIYAGFVGANVRRVWDNLAQGRRPLGLGYLVSFLQGSVDSLKYSVDRDKRLYVKR